MQLLRVDKERLNRSLQEVQEQFARLTLEFKKEVANATPTTPPTEPPMPNQVPLFFKYYCAHIHTHILTTFIKTEKIVLSSLCVQFVKLVAKNQELVQEMERVRGELEKTKFELEEKDRKSSTERDSDVCKRSFVYWF